MKARKILVFVIILLITGLVFFVGSVSYQSGVSYGESHAEEIRKSQVKEVNKVNSKKYASVKYVINELSPVFIKGSGRVNPGTIINVSSEVQGLLTSPMSLKKGTSFKKGELLFKIKDTDAKLALAARKSAFLSLLSQILPDLATDYSDQYDKWYNFFNSISVDQSLKGFPSFATNREKNFIISKNILAEFLNIKSDEYKLSKFQQTAPFSGSIVEAYSDEGAIINPGSPIIQIIRNDQLEIEIPVPVKYMDDIKIGKSVLLTENDKHFEGNVIRKGEFINPKTQSVPVYVRPSSSHPLYYGMYVQAKLEFDANDSVVKIPRKAIFSKNKIYTVNEDSTIRELDINIRSSDDDYYYTTGLKDSLMIVTQPLINAKDSIKVIPINK
jgi:membrane fusion protein, multidrug efflux system